MDAAKLYYFGHSGSFQDVIDTSILFGDPALKLRLPDPLLANSSLAVSRDWMPPGKPITVTATLANSGAMSTIGDLTLSLPTELEAPTSMTSTSSPIPVYDPLQHQVTWMGNVTPATVERVAFSSTISSGLSACGQVTVTGEVRDGLAAVTALEASVHLAVPDVDCNGRVDIVDVQQVTARWGTAQGGPGYHARYDLDGDNIIGVADVILVASHWH